MKDVGKLLPWTSRSNINITADCFWSISADLQKLISTSKSMTLKWPWCSHQKCIPSVCLAILFQWYWQSVEIVWKYRFLCICNLGWNCLTLLSMPFCCIFHNLIQSIHLIFQCSFIHTVKNVLIAHHVLRWTLDFLRLKDLTNHEEFISRTCGLLFLYKTN